MPVILLTVLKETCCCEIYKTSTIIEESYKNVCNLQNNDRININSTSLPLSLLLPHTYAHTHPPKHIQVNKQNIQCTFNVFLRFLFPKLHVNTVTASTFPLSGPSITQVLDSLDRSCYFLTYFYFLSLLFFFLHFGGNFQN